MKKNKIIKSMLSIAVCFLVCGTTLALTKTNAETITTNNQCIITDDKNISIDYGVQVPDNGLYDTDYKGVKVTTGRKGGTVKYNKEIDVRALKKQRTFIEIMPLSSEKDGVDFGILEIKLTDVTNPNNYFIMQMRKNPYPNNGNGAIAYMKVGGDTQKIVGVDHHPKGMRVSYDKSLYGCPVYFPFFGMVKNSRLNKPLKINFDYENQCVYAVQGVRSYESLVADLKADYVTALWDGFKSNKVEMSITISDVTAGKAEFMIFSIMGQSLDAKDIQDTVKPEIYVDMKGYNKAPAGFLQEFYPVFNGYLVDNFDGDIPFEPYVLYNGKDKVDIINDGFIPEKPGVYTICYEGKDSSDNVAESVYIDVEITTPTNIIYEFESPLKDSGKTGYEFIIPKGNALGGVGKINVVKTLIYPDGDEKIVEDLIIPQKSGTYRLNIEMTDFLNHKSLSSYWINIKAEKEPIIKEVSLPEKFINGASYLIPQFEAYDYFSYNEKDIALKTVLIKDSKGNVIETHNGDAFMLIVDSQKYGNSITLEFIAQDILYPEHSKKFEKTIDIVDTMNDKGIDIDKYFFQENITQVIDGDINNNHKWNTKFLTDKNYGKIKYLFPMPQQNIELYFSVPEIYNNVENITINLQDSLSKDHSISFEIKADTDNTSILTLNNKDYKINGAFGRNNEGFRLKIVNGDIYDKLGQNTGSFKYYDDGNKFNGFPSNSVYVSITVKNKSVGKLAGIQMERIGNQWIMDIENDYGSPFLYTDGFINRNAVWGSEVNIPYYKGFDILEGDTKAYISITAPDKHMICKDILSNKDGYKFQAMQYGEYLVSITSTDLSGNAHTQKITINVYDTTAPIVWFNDTLKTNYKVGDKLEIPEIKIFDDTDKKCRTMILLVEPDGGICNIDSNENYVFEKSGKYTLTVYVEDLYNNSTTINESLIIK